MFMGRRHIGFINIGRGFMRNLDCEITIGLIPRKDAREGEIAWHILLSVGWNWLPNRTYRDIRWNHGSVSSASWTGIDSELIAVHWRHWPHNFDFFFCPFKTGVGQ